MATTRPLISVYQFDNATVKDAESVKMPAVMKAAIRPDIIRSVHTNMAKNRRQAYGLSANSGYQTAAESWGTGRAVSRIPRVPGGGTHRAGQAAFGNMCRGGGMFAPTKTWRRWHRRTNVTQKRHAMASAVAASAVTSLVQARGHRVEKVPEFPLVVSAGAESLQKTKTALDMFKKLGCADELKKVVDSKRIRAGKGKLRNRRYSMRRGPLVVYSKDDGIARACRNIPGVDTCHVDRLNLLQVAPGGYAGRLIVWTAPAVERLNELFGSHTEKSAMKSKYRLIRSAMTNDDLGRIINSDEIQNALNPKLEAPKPIKRIGNPLRNLDLREKLNPGFKGQKKVAKRALTPGTKENAIMVKKIALNKATRRSKECRVASKKYARMF